MEIELWPIDRPVSLFEEPAEDSAVRNRQGRREHQGIWLAPVHRRQCRRRGRGGPHSLLAARKLGLFEVPVHVAADLTEAQCRAYRIADNRVGEEARWDDELLKLEISELGALADLTAFDTKELKRLGLAEDASQDAIPAPPADPVAAWGNSGNWASIGYSVAILRGRNPFHD